MKGLCRLALAALFVAACSGGDDTLTGPDSRDQLLQVPNGGVLAVGVDSTTGASIETNKDDYVPGEVVHVVGRGWAPGETVTLHMTESPDTHADVDTSVTADAAGGFNLHYYDVQVHDFGVTFTLTATGAMSNSVAVATFTDGNFTLRSAFVPVGGPSFTGSILKFAQSSSCDPTSSGQTPLSGAVTTTSGPTQGVNDNTTPPQSAALTVPATVPGYAFSHWTFSTSVTLVSGTINTTTICVLGTPPGGGGGRTFTANYVASNAAPVVSAGADAIINEGATFSQNGSFTDPDANTWTATVDYGDGSGSQALSLSGKNFSLSHLYTNDGVFNVTVTVHDGTTSHADVVQVTVNNVLPVVSAGADANISGGGTFTQAGSFTDPGADTWTATVNYGDGSGTQALALTGKTFNLSHTYASSGAYTVTVTVNDDDGSGADQVQVNVGNTAPTVSAGGDATINEGATFSQNGSFTDPDANSWTATVDYGDGSGSQALTLGAGKTFSLSHTYTDNGVYDVTVTVNDGTGTGSDVVKVTVNNVAPTVSAGADASVNEGSTFSQNGSFTDPGADTWTATVDYGDGSGVQPLTLVAKTFTLSHAYADNGLYTVTVTVTDDDTGTDNDVVQVTVNNVAPVVSAGADASINEGSTFSQNGSFTDPGADTWNATVDYGDGSGVQSLTLVGKTFALSHMYADNGVFTVTVTVTDDDAGTDDDVVQVTVNNVVPVVSAGADASINEGDTFTRNGSFTDPGADTWTATVNYGDGSGTQALTLGAGKTFSLSHTYTDNGVFNVTVTVTDDDAAAGSDVVQVTVINMPPVIGTITAPIDPVAVGPNNVTVTWNFTDPGADTWTCSIEWDTGLGFTSANLTVATKTCTATASLTPGLYSVRVKVTDDDGGEDIETISQYIVVYDPNGGFVTGGGWINSLAGFYRLDLAAAGKANFGFVSKYQPGKSLPQGNTEFQFHAGNLNFKSTVYEWLVVAGAKAMYKGEGTISGQTGVYGFLLSAIDGSPDKFRIKIWEKTTGNLIYDTLPIGAADDADPSTTLGGGSIVVHTKK